MITNISVLSPSAVYISVGQYNQHTMTLQVWFYRTRCKKNEDGDFIAEIPDFDFNLCKQAKKVVLVDNDWDERIEMTFNQFKKLPVANGVRKINLTKLTAKK